MAKFDPEKVAPGKRAWDPDNPGVGYYRRKDGKAGAWCVRFMAALPDGARVQRIETLLHCPNRTQALGALRKRQGSVFEGTYTARADTPTVEAFTQQFLRAKRELVTVKKYAAQLRGHLRKHFGSMRLAEISTADCEEYRRLRADAGAKGATIRNELRCLQSLFVEARKAGICDRDPVRNVEFGRIENERTRIASDAELDRLIAAAKQRSDYVRPLFFVLLYTGMRIAHATRLRWDEIQGLNTEVAQITTLPDKDAPQVTFPVAAELAAELRLWRKTSKASEWIFPARGKRNTKHRTSTGIQKGWAKLLASAKVSGLTRHDIRRTFITRLAREGATEKQIRSVTGQRTTAMITRYEQPDAATLLRVMEKAMIGP